MQNAVDFFDDSIVNLLQQERLTIAKINDSDYKFIARIKEINHKVTDDDALHLSSAINKKCQRFVTVDQELLDENFKSKIRKEFRIVIDKPK